MNDAFPAFSRNTTESRTNIVIVLSSRLLVADHETMGMVIQYISGSHPVLRLCPVRDHIHIISAAMMK